MRSQKLIMGIIWGMLTIFLVSACTSVSQRAGYLAPDLQFALPKNPWASSPQTAFQQVTIKFDGSIHHFQAVVDLKPGAAKISLLDLTGARAMDINWTADSLDIVQASWLPQGVRAEDILAHIVVAFWPGLEVGTGFPNGVSFSQSNLTRYVKNGTETLVLVTRDRDNPWASKTEISHTRSGFHLSITSSLAGATE